MRFWDCCYRTWTSSCMLKSVQETFILCWSEAPVLITVIWRLWNKANVPPDYRAASVLSCETSTSTPCLEKWFQFYDLSNLDWSGCHPKRKPCHPCCHSSCQQRIQRKVMANLIFMSASIQCPTEVNAARDNVRAARYCCVWKTEWHEAREPGVARKRDTGGKRWKR